MMTLRETLVETFNKNPLRPPTDAIDIAIEGFKAWIAQPWEDEDPALMTRIVEWVKGDDNQFWASACGDHQNAVDLLFWRVEFLEAC